LFYWFMKHIVIGPLVKLLWRPWVEGLENLPAEGPVILAPNHLSFMDSLFMPLMVPRRVVFLGKSDYFDKWYMSWFFKAVGVIPVRREGGQAGEASLNAGCEQLDNGLAVAIYPEGTRSPDGRLYRGKTGVARMAVRAGVPVIPVGIIGSFDVQPHNRKIPRVKGVRVGVRFGRPLDFTRYEGKEEDRFVLRSITDEIMYELMLLTGQEYVDEYAAKVKKQIQEQNAAGKSERRDDQPLVKAG
jgi:1-acyl-sn-glycerol-3-phosphate acyltransferase